ncbi:MAG: hypothetical protein MUQ30_13485, partial [Anaerolineae bacterium]|nr:hypothetical protein [Anaerolineae bacterium]
QRMLALRPAEVYHKKIAQELDVVVGVTCSGGRAALARQAGNRRGVCDVSRRRDISWQTSRCRDDVLVFDGGQTGIQTGLSAQS